VHHDHLIQRGIQPGQIISQPCDQLATEIEKGPAGKTVSQMIETYMQQAARNIDPDSGNIYAALCCTHFGYCQELIRDTLADLVEKPVTILNPNRQMAAYMFANRRENDSESKPSNGRLYVRQQKRETFFRYHCGNTGGIKDHLGKKEN